MQLYNNIDFGTGVPNHVVKKHQKSCHHRSWKNGIPEKLRQDLVSNLYLM